MNARNRQRLAIVDGLRTPFCKMGTSLAALPADELARQAVVALLARTGLDPALVNEVVFGCVGQPAEAANIARVIALRACIPEHVPAATVQRNCASGCEAITTAYERVCSGHGDLFIVGGTESMSQAPLLLSQQAAVKLAAFSKARSLPARLEALSRFRACDLKPRAGLQLGLTDPVSGLNMGETAELVGREWEVDRHAQDEFALRSHVNAAAARGKLAEEITPVYTPAGETVTEDNGVRPGQTLDALAELKPVFDKGLGTVTAGNASQISDGAVALLVMSEERAADLGYKPLGWLVDYVYTGCDPRRMGLGPVAAIQQLAKRGFELGEADLVEINEAFAVQVIAVLRKLAQSGLSIDKARLNVNGGAIALGHPVGASGARLVLTTLRELRRRGGGRGLVSLCIGGGQGAALLLEAAET